MALSGELNVTFSAYAFGARPASTDPLMLRDTVCGVVPLVGDTVRKSGPPFEVEVETVKFKGVLELVTWSVCAPGVVVPVW